MPALKRKRSAPKAVTKKATSKAKAPSKAKAVAKGKAVAKKAVKASKRTSKANSKAGKADDSESEEEKIVESKTSISNGVMVDSKVPNATAHSVVKAYNTVLNCNMMFSDCSHNNNKFYIIQGLK
jgi:GTP cyclohydrolase III